MPNHAPALALSLSILFLGSLPARALDVEEVFVGIVEDREQDTDLVYVFVLSLIGEDIAGGRVYKPGNATPICDLELDAVFLGFDATCNIAGSSVADLCAQFGFGTFLVEIDDAFGGADDTMTVVFDPGCDDAFPGDVDIASPSAGSAVPPLPEPSTFCFDCTVPDGCADFWQMELSDDFGNFGTAEFLENPARPGCWDVASCLPQGNDYTFRASSIELFDDAVPAATDGGDAFALTRFYQDANLEYFNVLAGAPTTPSAVPAGTGATFPMFVGKRDPAGSTLDVYWDAFSCCGKDDAHLLWGSGDGLPTALGGTYTIGGSRCGIGDFGEYAWSGTPAPADGELVWWLVLNGDGADTEGSWGVDSAGQERMGPGVDGASLQCGATAKSTGNTCGR